MTEISSSSLVTALPLHSVLVATSPVRLPLSASSVEGVLVSIDNHAGILLLVWW